MRTVKYAILLFYLIVKSSSQPVPLHQESQESFVAGAVRVKRQAGYVYDKPSVPFNLPTGAPTVSTQAPTVDRTQAQMMYYAYPAPAPAAVGKEVVIGGGAGGSSGTSAGSTATASADTTSDGYKYGAQNTAPAEAQSISATGSSQSSAGSTQLSSTGSSGYGYNAPSAGTANGYQTSSAGSSQTASSSGSASGYAYNTPTKTQSDSGATQTVDVSTNAPKYLPPTSDGGYTSGSISTGSGTISSVSSSSAADIPSDQYLPPLGTPNPPASLAPTGPTVGVASTGSVPSSNYIPPERASSQSPIKNDTPRPFSPAPPPNGYLPPNYIPPEQAPSPLPTKSDTPRPFSPAPPPNSYIPPYRAPSPFPINNDNPRPTSPAPAPPPNGYLPPKVLYQAPAQNFPSTQASAYLPPTL